MYRSGFLRHERASILFMIVTRVAGMFVGYVLFGIFGALVGALVAVFVDRSDRRFEPASTWDSPCARGRARL